MSEPSGTSDAASPAVWFITRKYPPRIGGMERLSWELTTRMAARRPIRVLALRGSSLWLPFFMIRSAVALMHAVSFGTGLRSRRPGLVHLGDAVLSPLALVARHLRIPVCMAVHGRDVVYRHPLYRLWLRLFMHNMDAYVCNSQATRDAMLTHDVPASKLHVIGLGVETSGDRSPCMRDPNLLLYVGRLVPRKGLAWFVAEIMPILARRHVKLRLGIIGVGSHRAAVDAAARRAGIASRLLWLGEVSEKQKWNWLQRALLCVMPNIAITGDMEGFGITAIEAASAGCALVASDIEGLRDAAGTNPGAALVGAGNVNAWIGAIDRRLRDPLESSRLGEAARAWAVENASWESVCERHELLFNALLGAKW